MFSERDANSACPVQADTDFIYNNIGLRESMTDGNGSADMFARFIVSKIVAWDDLVDHYGRTVVTSCDKPTENWS